MKKGKESFQAKLLRPTKPVDKGSWAFILLPKNISKQLPRRGRMTIEGSINNYPFSALLEPDGQLSHWLQINSELQKAAKVAPGDTITLQIRPVEKEPEPDVPPDLEQALVRMPKALETWEKTTTVARLDWIHWITSTQKPKIRTKRVADACDKLAAGRKRVCCFDTSGFYSKAFRAPEFEDSTASVNTSEKSPTTIVVSTPLPCSGDPDNTFDKFTPKAKRSRYRD